MTIETTTHPLVDTIGETIALERVGPLRFRGRTFEGLPSRTYGGEVAGQAVLAAGATVPAGRLIHSAQMQFLLPGDTTLPVELEVEETRNGGSFSTRRVDALQGGRVIFQMSASFQEPEDGLSHQVPVVEAAGPEDSPTPADMFAGDPENLAWVTWLTDKVKVDARFVDLPARAAAARGSRTEPRQRVWLKARQREDSKPIGQAAALAYLSDVLLLSVALGPHELTLQGGRLQFATIGHSIWFHAPLSVDQWFLYDQRGDWAGNGRALCRGEIYDLSGRLCATVMQEGLLRLRG